MMPQGTKKTVDPDALAEARKQLEAEQVEKAKEAKKLQAVVDKLGLRTVTRMVMKEVVVGKGDRGPIVSRKEVPEQFTVLSSDLTAEEAAQLGDVKWTPIDVRHNQYTTKAQGTSEVRRFVISKEVYEELHG